MERRSTHGSVRVARHLLVVALVVIGGVSGARAQAPPPFAHEAYPGYDLFVTDEANTDLLGIVFQGEPLPVPLFDFDPDPILENRKAIGPTDTIVRRIDTAGAISLGSPAAPIGIELVLLSLKSAAPLDPGPFATGLPGTYVPGDQRHLYVTLQKDRTASDAAAGWTVPGPASLGTMDVTFEADGGPNAGGTFSADFLVFADLRYDGPTGPIVCGGNLPPCADFAAGLTLASADQNWGRDQPGDALRIRGVNYMLAGPGDRTKDFWGGVDRFNPVFVCVAHGGHPDPGGAPTRHGTCATPCISGALGQGSGCDGRDNDCDGIIDDCAEDLWQPEPFAPGTVVIECAPVVDVRPAVCGVPHPIDDCNPSPPTEITDYWHDDFITELCGNTFDVDRIWSARDQCGRVAVSLQQIHVVDTTPPSFTVTDGPQFDIWIWPPGHGYFLLSTSALVSASDTCGEATVAVTGCTSSQPENVTGQTHTPGGANGDGNTVEDCVLSVDGQQFAVRSERDGACGRDSSRTYTVAFTATDECGNQSQTVGLVHIAHDRSEHEEITPGVMLGPNEPPPFPYVHPTTYGPGC